MSTEDGKLGLLEVRDLSVEYGSGPRAVRALDRVSLRLRPGERLGIVGESGSGKTTFGLALAGLLPKSGHVVEGSVSYGGQDLVQLRPRQLRRIRGREIAVVFQDAKTALNPVRTIGSQIAEAVRAHRPVSRSEAIGVAARLLGEVELPDPPARLAQYPHELSGGMRQRAMIAMALAGEPKILVADEPTSALDVTTQANIMLLLARLGEERQMSTILITHDLGVVAGFTQSVLVLYASAAMEAGPVDAVFGRAAHPYTRALIGAVPSLTGPRSRRLAFIPGTLPSIASARAGCRFEPRCAVGRGRKECLAAEPEFLDNGLGTTTACFFAGEVPPSGSSGDEGDAGPPAADPVRSRPLADTPEALVVVDAVSRTFMVRRRGQRSRVPLRALDTVSFSVERGESFGIVGESGSGKTTLARIIVGLLPASSGRIEIRVNENGTPGGKKQRRGVQPGSVQMVFQDPGDSLDPLMLVQAIIGEPLEITMGRGHRRYRKEIGDALDAVGLGPEMLVRRSSELSGGQRQRVAIARALTTSPSLLVADEAVASLDMSARGQVLNLLDDIQQRTGLTCVHISHDLSMVRHVCDRVAVMHAGRIVELADADTLFGKPRHPYTAGLISAIPTPDPAFERLRQRIPVIGELPDLTRAVAGCPYRTRCPSAQERCALEDPPLVEHSPGHLYACHFPEHVDDLVAAVAPDGPTGTGEAAVAGEGQTAGADFSSEVEAAGA